MLAGERVRTSPQDAWHFAAKTNTIASYKRFIEVWPDREVLVNMAQSRISEIKRTSPFWKTLDAFLRIVYVAAMIFILFFAFQTVKIH